MKKLIKLIMALLLLVCLCACDKNETPDNNGDTNLVDDVYTKFADKTFYNTYDASECGDYSSITFNKDKTFVINDIYVEGTVLFKGTYTIENTSIKLKVEESGLGNYTEILFSIIKDNVINLQTDLIASNAGNTYICCEKKDLEKTIESERTNTNTIIAGKTFYNSVDRYENINHSYIVFNGNGTFDMYEHYLSGYVGFEGTWQANEYKINCKVNKVDLGEYEEVVFYIKNFETLVLETNLFGSKDGDEYLTREIKGFSNEIEKPVGLFINLSQKEAGNINCSSLDLRQDGSFTLIEISNMGATEVNGRYGIEGDVLMFSNFDVEPYDMYGEKLYNFEFRILNSTTLELMTDIESSYKGNYFCLEEYVIDSSSYTDAQYLHAEIPDVLNEYLPTLQLYIDGTFSFIENVYAGMGEYKGTYQLQGNLYVLTVTDKSSMQGFMGYDVNEIVFERVNDGLMLHTALCMSQENDMFYLQ